MRTRRCRWCGAVVFLTTLLLLAGKEVGAQGDNDDRVATKLPRGVSAVWDLTRAYRESTETRERICINGLWRWQPAQPDDTMVPDARWGFFKVPGCWPGITDYMQKDCQTVFAHPEWRDQRLRDAKAAWYQRQIMVPDTWRDRRIVLQANYVNSFASVYVDGQRRGEIRFPGGEVDLTGVCQSGRSYMLSLHVIAMPLQAVMLSYNDSASASQVAGRVARRGLCGDVFLASEPDGPRVDDVKINTSVRDWRIEFEVACRGLEETDKYSLQATVRDGNRVVKKITSDLFPANQLDGHRKVFSEAWRPDKLWNVDSPANTYSLQMSICDKTGRVLDSGYATRFGFREFWIDGRDFYLNGTRIFLSSVPLDNAQVGAAWATYDGALESMKRLQSIGINFVYTHNYGCQPGSHLGFSEILRAADDAGMLIALSQPHFSHYDWDDPDADHTNGYARHAEFYVRVAQNHPSVVAYATSHNATGYAEDMNPDMIDGIQARRSQWAVRNVQRALRAERIIKSLDSSRVVYHHASGNLGAMHTSNFYANFAPAQEMSDWFERWATEGVKPVFTCEYSVPLSWDWTLYRGWYKGHREFGSARAPWEFTLAEWNAQFIGDEAYRISQREKANLRWEAKQFRAGRVWQRWDYPTVVGSSDFAERHPIFAMYFDDNWPAFRTWGVSAIAPWNHGHYWILRDGVDSGRTDLPVDWQDLQRPGFSPDYLDERYERVDLAYEMSDWIPTVAAKTLLRNNQPLLAYIAGKPGAFTSKDHNFTPGETFEKQLIVINNSRQPVGATCRWALELPEAISGECEIEVAAGDQQRVKMRFTLPSNLAPGAYRLDASARFSTGQQQDDTFELNVLQGVSRQPPRARIAAYDPPGETRQLLDRLGVSYVNVGADSDLSDVDLLVVGKQALTLSGPAPAIGAVREGLKVLLFEQSPEVVEQRLGFRVATYGLRKVFERLPDHPALTGLDEEHLHDWRGAATVVPPRLDYQLSPKFNYTPTVRWCGIEVPRVWRCGTRGNVATVLIEKPHRGDFLPIVDGGYSLQYSPLLEYREGRGMILFCQMDVTGRADDSDEPAARILARNLIDYALDWKPVDRRTVVYAGEPAGSAHLRSIGIAPKPFAPEALNDHVVLVVGRGGGRQLAAHSDAIAGWLSLGGRILAAGLDEQEANAILPDKVQMTNQEHIATWFKPPGLVDPLAGVGPADVHNSAPGTIPLLSGPGAVGNGVLGTAGAGKVIFSQVPPWDITGWEDQHNLKRTFRRHSFLFARLLANLGASGTTPIVERFSSPVMQGDHVSLLQNGDFTRAASGEQPADGWIFSGSGQASAAREQLESDASHWCVSLNSPVKEGKSNSAMLAQHDVPMEKDQWYRISLRARAEQLESNSVTLTITNMDNWRSFFDYQQIEPDEAWKTFAFVVQANATAARNTRFQIWFEGAGKVDIADVRVEPIADPTQGRWLDGLYLDQPETWDDPYRFFRW